MPGCSWDFEWKRPEPDFLSSAMSFRSSFRIAPQLSPGGRVSRSFSALAPDLCVAARTHFDKTAATASAEFGSPWQRP